MKLCIGKTNGSFLSKNVVMIHPWGELLHLVGIFFTCCDLGFGSIFDVPMYYLD